jgi:DNA excision repair protein ERCC-2
MKTLNLAITDFAVPSPRMGSIEIYSGYGGLPNSGGEIHLEIQAGRMNEEPNYQAEKWTQHTFDQGEYKILVGGRMDGYIPGLPPRIEEIKSAFNPADLIKALNANPHHPYLLQLRTYGYLHYQNTGQIAELDLLIVSSRNRQVEVLPVDLDLPDYQAWLKKRLAEIASESKMFEAVQARRRDLTKKFEFPFPEPRRGQIELMQTVEKEMGKKSRLLLQAPTGLGKTAGILFPVLKEALKRGQKVIYVTPKNSQHAVGEDAVRRLQDTGTKVKGLTINAKAKLCFKTEVICNPEYCEFAKNYYTKVSENKLSEKLAKKKQLTSKTFEKLGKEYEVCPFELQMEALPRADVVICDYNYVFSPYNSLGKLTYNGYGKATQANLVIDEAHNLPARANDYFSSKISVRDFEEVRPTHGHEPVVQETIDLIRGSGFKAGPVELDKDAFRVQDAKIQEMMLRHIESPAEIRPRDPVIKLANDFSNFTRALDSQGEQFYFTYNPALDGGTLKVTCCDAGAWLKEGYNAFANVVAFSATVKPFAYYSRLLGFEEGEVVTGEFTSPFPREHRKLLIIPQVSTKFNDRQANYGKISEGIQRIVAVKPGNYFAFFPSFDFLYKIAERLDLPDVEILLQTRDMKKSQINDYLEKLRSADHPVLVLAVQGGVFSEGVDYPGNMLIGAIVVGPGLPSFDFERELLRCYYEKKYGHGFDYAYTYPAMAKVVQSAGRVIRSHDDLGLIILMDRRFTHESYLKAMPADWVQDDVGPLLSNQLIADITAFWKAHEGQFST